MGVQETARQVQRREEGAVGLGAWRRCANERPDQPKKTYTTTRIYPLYFRVEIQEKERQAHDTEGEKPRTKCGDTSGRTMGSTATPDK